MCDNIGNGDNGDSSVKKRTLLAGAVVAALGGGVAIDAYTPDNYSDVAATTIVDDRIEEVVDRESPGDHPVSLVRYHARGVVSSMTAIHGGKWRIQIDHENLFVAISQDIIT